MRDSSGSRGMFDNNGVLEFTGKVMVLAFIFLAFVVVFVSCLHIYSKWFWSRRPENVITTSTRRRRRLDFAAAQQEMRRGLDPSVLKTIPVIVFDPKEVKDELECAVCLCEVSAGEKARLLPKCNHGFHVECIDMWFQSHSTCPLCRNPIAIQNQSNSAVESTLETILQAPVGESSGVSVFLTDAPNFPTNVLIWGNETQVSTFGPSVEENNASYATTESSGSSSSSSMGSTSGRPDGILVIDIPRPINEEDEQKSPAPTRLRSLKRLLSGNRRANPSSPRNLDIEQGGRS